MSQILNTYFTDGKLRESIKTLRTNIDFAGIDSYIKAIVVSSAKKGEGKSTVSSSLAIAEAESGKRTLLLDCDFRAPQVAKRFNVRNPHTLIDILNIPEGTDMASFCEAAKVPNLYILDVGSRRISNPIEVLSSNKFQALLSRCYEAFDFVIIDAPPIGLFIDGAVISRYTDGVLLVIGAGRTTAVEVKEVLSQLEKANAHVIGTVLNGVKPTKSSYYYYYYYDQSGRKKKKRHGGESTFAPSEEEIRKTEKYEKRRVEVFEEEQRESGKPYSRLNRFSDDFSKQTGGRRKL